MALRRCFGCLRMGHGAIALRSKTFQVPVSQQASKLMLSGCRFQSSDEFHSDPNEMLDSEEPRQLMTLDANNSYSADDEPLEMLSDEIPRRKLQKKEPEIQYKPLSVEEIEEFGKIAKNVRGLSKGVSRTLHTRLKKAAKACHSALVSTEGDHARIPANAAATMFLSMSMMRGSDMQVQSLMRHALNGARDLSSAAVVDIMRGIMLWKDAPFGVAKRLSEQAVLFSIDKLDDQAIATLAGCMIKLKINHINWMVKLEEFVIKNGQRLAETEDGFRMLAKMVFAVCSNTVADEKMVESVRDVLDTCGAELILTQQGVDMIWCCLLSDILPEAALRLLFTCEENVLRQLADDKAGVKRLNDVHWFFYDGLISAEFVGGFGPVKAGIINEKFNAFHSPRRFHQDWRTHFAGARSCLFDVRTRENYTLDVAALRGSTTFGFIGWNDAQMLPLEVTESKMARRKDMAAEAVYILSNASYITMTHFPLGWVRMQKKILSRSGWAVTLINAHMLNSRPEALKKRMDGFHLTAVMHAHGRSQRGRTPRDVEQNFLAPKVDAPPTKRNLHFANKKRVYQQTLARLAKMKDAPKR